MNFKKKELKVSIIMIIVFLMIGLNFCVLATSDDTATITFNTINSNVSNNTINVIGKDSENIPVETNNNTNTTNTNAINTNSTKQSVPNTGLEDVPFVVIAVCTVSALFAYKKVKEYKSV